MSINNNDQQNNSPMAQNEMPTLDPIVQAYSPLLQQQFQPLGATIFMALQRLHQNDKYSFRLKEYAYWCYLVKHPEVVGEYMDSLEAQDYMVGSNLMIRIAEAIKDKIKYLIIKVSNTQEETRNIIKRLTGNPGHQLRDLTVDIIKQNFDCDENGLEELRNYIHEIHCYTGSMLSVGVDGRGGTVLIIHVFSVE